VDLKSDLTVRSCAWAKEKRR